MREISVLTAKGAARSVLAAVFVAAIVFAPGAGVPALAGAGPALPPTPAYTCNLNGDEYFGDGYTTLDNTEWLIWLDWVIYLHWLPPHMNMAQQLTTGMTYQALMVGALLDAKNEQETQRLMQQMAAEAHRDYQPDLTMCTFGTNVRSLAATEDKERVNTRLLDLTMLKRHKLSQDISSASAVNDDLKNRFEQFKHVYCDTNDDNNYLPPVCGAGNPADRINNDIDYTKLIENRYTLDADFTDPAPTPQAQADQEDIMALTRNIIGFRTFDKISDDHLKQEFAKNTYMDTRSVNAMRSVAGNSIAHIIGMRMAGTPCASCVGSTYMRPVLLQLGVPDVDIDKFLGSNPSYYAQMEVLTHKVFENEGFFTNLYTTPANVERIGATLQALKLMQDRDRFESSLRREMLLSLILEVQIRDRESRVEAAVRNGSNTLIGN
jgi:hypothetical protein